MSAFFYLRRLLRSVSGRGPTASGAAAIDFGAWNLNALANAWRTARPYSHVVIDDLVPDRGLAALCEAVLAEPHQRTRGEIFDMLGSAETVAHPTLRAFHVSLGSEKALSAVHAITGKRPRRVVMRSFIYLDGSYLLPHTDHRDELGRLVAFAYYLQADGEGGELDSSTAVRPATACSTFHPRFAFQPVATGSCSST